MKVIWRAIIRVIPGKMAEYMEVEKKLEAIATREGMPLWRRYMRLSGDSMHTIVYEMEFDSMAAMEAFLEKMMAPNPESKELTAKLDALIESQADEFYTPMP